MRLDAARLRVRMEEVEGECRCRSRGWFLGLPPELPKFVNMHVDHQVEDVVQENAEARATLCFPQESCWFSQRHEALCQGLGAPWPQEGPRSDIPPPVFDIESQLLRS